MPNIVKKMLLGFMLVVLAVLVAQHALKNALRSQRTPMASHKPQSQSLVATPVFISVTSVRGEARLYPNPNLTQGDILTASSGQVCVYGYAQSVRNVSLELKLRVYAKYGIPFPQPSGTYELDHFIPLELGGSNDPKNLWTEPAEPRPGYHEKYEVENYLHKEVCEGVISLQEAQREIKSDWYAVYRFMGSRM